MPAATVPVDRAVQAIVQRILALGDKVQGMGKTEMEFRRAIQELACVLEGEVLSRQAEKVETSCPDCGEGLVRVKRRERHLQTVHGEIRMKRAYGRCRTCGQWVAPADRAWGLEDSGEISPLLRDIVSWVATVTVAVATSQAVEKTMGIEVCPAQVDREAKRAGERAVAQRREATEQAVDVEGRKAVMTEARKHGPGQPFVLVVMADGWMISERWQWHEVKSGSVFRLDQRGRKGKRPIITEREYVATREGPEVLSEMLWAAALRCGLAQAREVLFIADGAVWIWNLQRDRFPWARCLLDFPHGRQHLWTVAHELYGEGTEEARQWVEPLLHQLRHGPAAGVIQTLDDLKAVVRKPKHRQVIEREKHYFETHRDHLDYATFEQLGYPLGSGAMESACKQFQTRFKRSGQFWTQPGDEKLLCLTTFRMSGRWHELWPHLQEAA